MYKFRKIEYRNDLEGRLAELEYELSIAEMNNWEFDIACIQEEINSILNVLESEVF